MFKATFSLSEVFTDVESLAFCLLTARVTPIFSFVVFAYIRQEKGVTLEKKNTQLFFGECKK